MEFPFEQFPALSALGFCRHVFTHRIHGIEVLHDKGEVLKRLDAAHREIRKAIDMADWALFTAKQIHGNKIAFPPIKISRSATCIQMVPTSQ